MTVPTRPNFPRPEPLLDAASRGRQFAWRSASALVALSTALLCTTPTAAAVRPTTATASPAVAESSDLQLASFEKAWQLINDRYWDPEFGGLDWEAVREELRPQAEEAETNEELREVLDEMIERLGQSHFGVIPGDEAGPVEDVEGDLDEEGVCSPELRAQLMDRVRSTSEGGSAPAETGLRVGFVEGEVYVTEVEENSSASEKGIEPGWRLIEVEGVEVDVVAACFGDDLEEKTLRNLVFRTVTGLLKGEPSTTVSARLLPPEADAEESVELERRVPADVETVKFGNLPAIDVRFAVERNEGIVSVRFNVWMMPIAQLFEELALELDEADGLLLDLRGNPGGVAALAPGVAGYLLDEKQSLGTLRYRTNSLELVAMPRRVTRSGESIEIFQGPVAILIDAQSASTSEIFAASLQDFGRARLFGERTMAAALPAVVEELPNGDYLMHALADLLRPNGGRIEGVGVTPDVEVPVTLEGLRAGRDEVRLAALAWLAEEIAKEQTEQNEQIPAGAEAASNL